jgi:hypothetical protein
MHFATTEPPAIDEAGLNEFIGAGRWRATSSDSARPSHRGDLSGRAARQFQAELACFLQQFRAAAHRAQVGACWRSQSIKTLLAVRANPTVQCDARIGPLAAIWMDMRLASQFAHQLPTFSWTQARIRRGNNCITGQGDGFTWFSAHKHLRVQFRG